MITACPRAVEAFVIMTRPTEALLLYRTLDCGLGPLLRHYILSIVIGTDYICESLQG